MDIIYNSLPTAVLIFYFLIKVVLCLSLIATPILLFKIYKMLKLK